MGAANNMESRLGLTPTEPLPMSDYMMAPGMTQPALGMSALAHALRSQEHIKQQKQAKAQKLLQYYMYNLGMTPQQILSTKEGKIIWEYATGKNVGVPKEISVSVPSKVEGAEPETMKVPAFTGTPTGQLYETMPEVAGIETLRPYSGYTMPQLKEWGIARSLTDIDVDKSRRVRVSPANEEDKNDLQWFFGNLDGTPWEVGKPKTIFADNYNSYLGWKRSKELKATEHEFELKIANLRGERSDNLTEAQLIDVIQSAEKAKTDIQNSFMLTDQEKALRILAIDMKIQPYLQAYQKLGERIKGRYGVPTQPEKSRIKPKQ